VVLALSGASGSGKSTVARRIGRTPGWVRLAEAFDRLHPRPRLDPRSPEELRALELRLLAEESRRYCEATGRAAEGRSVVADTTFLDPVVYTAGLLVLGQASPGTFLAIVRRARQLIARGELGLPDLTVYLVTSAATRGRRASRDPARHPLALRARHERVGRFEAAVVRRCLKRGAPGRVRGVRADGSAASVAERVRRLSVRPGPIADPAAAAERALAALLAHREIRRALGRSGNLKRGTPSPRPPR
jgi:AAA domain